MPRDNVPRIGRPFHGVVREAQMNEVFTEIGHLKSMSVSHPLTLTHTAGGGYRLGIQLPKPVKAVAAAPAVAVKQFEIVASIVSDSIVCRPFDGTEADAETTVWVAKPWFLRGADTWKDQQRRAIEYTNYNATHTERTATSLISRESERQRVIPDYLAGDVIVAIKVATGVIVPGQEEEEEPGMVAWLDLNTTGRMWAAVR